MVDAAALVAFAKGLAACLGQTVETGLRAYIGRVGSGGSLRRLSICLSAGGGSGSRSSCASPGLSGPASLPGGYTLGTGRRGSIFRLHGRTAGRGRSGNLRRRLSVGSVARLCGKCKRAAIYHHQHCHSGNNRLSLHHFLLG